jgi:hypothetical protein
MEVLSSCATQFVFVSLVGKGQFGIDFYYSLVVLVTMNPSLAIDIVHRYFTRVRAPKGSTLKIGLIAVLALVIISQLLSGSSSKSDHVLVLKPVNELSDHYENVLSDFDSLSLNERCLKFFAGLLEKPETFDLGREFQVAPNFDMFVKSKKQEDLSPDDATLDVWKQQYNSEYAKAKAVEEKFTKFISNTRVYGKCFIENNIFAKESMFWSDSSEEDESQKFHLSNEFGVKLFPWTPQVRPVFKRFGLKTVETVIPEVSNSYTQQTEGRASFFHNFRSSLNGKGIVIPVQTKKDYEYTLHLIKLLRFLNVNLPVQIVHKGFLNPEQEVSLYHALTDDVNESSLFSDEILESLPVGFNSEFPPIEDAWVVNIALVFDDNYTRDMTSATFKTASLLFSSFEEVILLDPLTVPMRRLFELFDTIGYKKTGSYYFPNYRLNEPSSPNEVEFVENLFPTNVDEHVFGITNVLKEPLQDSRLFGDNMAYSVSTDVIALNTKTHFLGLLLSLHLQFSKVGFKTKDLKNDMPWLGPLIAGTPQLHIHEVPVSVIGDFTPDENKVIQSVSKEICSIHRAYLDSFDGSAQPVLFITNGVSNCNADVTLEEETKLRFYSSFKDKGKAVRDRTLFKAVIVPGKQEVTSRNSIGEVERFITNEYGICDSESWCAYDVLGARYEPQFQAQVVKFDDQGFQLLELVSKVWGSKVSL